MFEQIHTQNKFCIKQLIEGSQECSLVFHLGVMVRYPLIQYNFIEHYFKEQDLIICINKSVREGDQGWRHG
jgi:hypothetical protein